MTSTLVATYILGVGLGAGGCESTSSGGSGGGDATGSLTLSGQAVARAGDVSGLRYSALALKNAIIGFEPKFVTIGDTPLAGADVTLVQINADGTEETVSGVTATTDSSGNYTLSNVPATVTGTGESTDFYYEVRVENGDGYVAAPLATEADVTVNVSPETHLAARMLTEASETDASGSEHLVPAEDVINTLREAALDEISGTLEESILIPDLSEDDQVNILATALTSDGGDIEAAMESVEAEREYLALEESTDSDAVASYLAHATRQACNFNSSLVLPESAMEQLAEVFTSDGTLTIDEVVAAYNESNGSDPDTTTDSAVTEIDGMLDAIESALSGDAELSTANQVLSIADRDLTSSTFSATTELEVDQALAFAQTLLPTACDTDSFDVVGFANTLSGEDTDPTSQVTDAVIYHDSTGACPAEGHLQANVNVYASGSLTTTAVTVAGGGNNVSLTSMGTSGHNSRWRIASDNCVNLPSDVDYTITATFSDASIATMTKTVPHREVQEANISLVEEDGDITPLINGAIGKVPVSRPTFKWSPEPGTPTTTALSGATVPENTKIKFIFELSHVFTTDFLSDVSADAGHTVNQGPLSQCALGGSGAKLMDKNYFVSDTDCDIAGCLAALQDNPTLNMTAQDSAVVSIDTSTITTTDIACRTNIQTYLVDEFDNIIGQAAGNFRSYCVDADSDGNCD